MLDSSPDKIFDELRGRITYDYDRLTGELLVPRSIALERLEMLFESMLDTLKGRSHEQNAMHTGYGGHIMEQISLPFHGRQEPFSSESQWVLSDVIGHLPHDTFLDNLFTATEAQGLQPTPEGILSGHSELSDSQSSLAQRHQIRQQCERDSLLQRSLDQSRLAADIHVMLSACPQIDITRVSLLTYLAISFASPPRAFEFLETLSAIRNNPHVPLPPLSMPTNALMSSMDRLELCNQWTAFLRRVHLALLVQRYEENATCSAESAQDETSRRLQSSSKRRRLATSTLDRMTSEYMLDADREKWRSRLKNRLYAGKLWHRMFSMYSLGGLALFPTDISTTRLEQLHNAEITELLNALKTRADSLPRICAAASAAIIDCFSNRDSCLPGIPGLDSSAVPYDSEYLVLLLQAQND